MRKLIRNAVKAVVEKIADFELVEIGRRHSVSAADLPAALIYTDSEKSSGASLDSTENVVELKVDIKVKPDGETAGEDDLDDLIAKVDAVVIPAVGAISGIQEILPDAIDIDADGSADADYLMGTRTYTVEYYTDDS